MLLNERRDKTTGPRQRLKPCERETARFPAAPVIPPGNNPCSVSLIEAGAHFAAGFRMGIDNRLPPKEARFFQVGKKNGDLYCSNRFEAWASQDKWKSERRDVHGLNDFAQPPLTTFRRRPTPMDHCHLSS